MPFLIANARAAEAGQEMFTVELLGKPWTQGTFRYPAKCLQTLRRNCAALSEVARSALDAALERTGRLAALRGQA